MPPSSARARPVPGGRRGRAGGWLGAAAYRVAWEFGYATLPPRLVEIYAYCEIAGPRGPISTPDLILGFVLFAPGAFYPPHNHPEIEESYVTVAGG